jgi:hypothetical protein
MLFTVRKKGAFMNEAMSTSVNPAAQIHDLRELIGERGVIELVLEEVQALGDALAANSSGVTLMPRSRLVLTLLTYCCAAGIYGSEDIEWACRNDSGAHYISANTPIDQETIRRFRRLHRSWIEHCLSRTMLAASSSQPPLSRAPQPLVAADQKLDIASMMDMAMCD